MVRNEEGMLSTHLANKETELLAAAASAAVSGSSVNKGTPREDFIKHFLCEHLSQHWSIGSGEVIDAESRPGETRPQMDIVIYKRNYPRLHLSKDICAYLAESVVATIEVKSLLDYNEFKKSVKAAATIKGLKRSLHTSMWAGYQPPAIISCLAAYDGPEKMSTVHSWVAKAHRELGITVPELAGGRDIRERTASSLRINRLLFSWSGHRALNALAGP